MCELRPTALQLLGQCAYDVCSGIRVVTVLAFSVFFGLRAFNIFVRVFFGLSGLDYYVNEGYLVAGVDIDTSYM